MSVIREFYRTREDGVNLYRCYSDNGMMLEQDQTGILYEDPIDVEDTQYTYTETNTPIPVEPATDEDYQAIGKIMMGVEENEDS